MEICRVCLKSSARCFSIFDESLGIISILEQHFPFEFPSAASEICPMCWSKIKEFHQFYSMVQQVQIEWSEDKKPDINHYTNEDDNAEALSRSETLYKTELIVLPDPNDDFSTFDDPSTEKPFSCTAVDTTVRNPIDETNTDHIKRTCKSDDMKTTKSRVNGKRGRALKIRAFDDDNVDWQLTTPKRQTRRTVTSENDEIIKKHITISCYLCTFIADQFSELRQHFKQWHPEKRPYVLCCGRKLSKGSLMVQHALKHENPDLYNCTKCTRIFFDAYTMRAHMAANHVPKEQLKYNCDICDRRFARQHLLTLHKATHIPESERRFICEKCPHLKPFASNHLLQVHNGMRHNKAANICHICAKEIRDKPAFEKHVRLHTEDSGPRVKCPHPGCDCWLKDEDNLKTHMRCHRNEGPFICPECGKKLKTKRSLKSHIAYSHSDESFACERCDKTFKRPLSLKEHMSQHTGESLYKCPFCTRTFNSNANMHSHKKRMHPIEWNIWRRTKRGNSQHEASNQHVLEQVAKCLGGDVLR